VSVSESQRHQVFQWFEEAMGPERAAVIMEMLPPVGWADLATKDDVRALGVEVRGEIAELRGEIAEVRGEIAELRGELHHAFARSQRATYLSILASNATIAGVVLAAVQLG
jgi:hypothetical protein